MFGMVAGIGIGDEKGYARARSEQLTEEQQYEITMQGIHLCDWTRIMFNRYCKKLWWSHLPLPVKVEEMKQ